MWTGGHLVVFQVLQTQKYLRLGLPAPGFPLPGSWWPWSLLQGWAPVGLEGFGAARALPPLLQPLPEAARGRSHLCLLASILCFSGGKVVSRQLLWETEAPGYLLQRRGLLASAVPSQLGSKAQLAVLGSALRSSVKCPGGGQNVII